MFVRSTSDYLNQFTIVRCRDLASGTIAVSQNTADRLLARGPLPHIKFQIEPRLADDVVGVPLDLFDIARQCVQEEKNLN